MHSKELAVMGREDEEDIICHNLGTLPPPQLETPKVKNACRCLCAGALVTHSIWLPVTQGVRGPESLPSLEKCPVHTRMPHMLGRSHCCCCDPLILCPTPAPLVLKTACHCVPVETLASRPPWPPLLVFSFHNRSHRLTSAIDTLRCV
jgi:hypothetical protein